MNARGLSVKFFGAFAIFPGDVWLDFFIALKEKSTMNNGTNFDIY